MTRIISDANATPDARGGEGRPPARGPVNPVPILRYSTRGLPPEARYRTWYLRDWPRSEPIYRTEPTEPFNTSWQSVQLGQVMLVHTQITGMRWERRRQDIRVSDFDPIIVNLMIEGEAHGDMDGRPFHEMAGMLHFHDLARPSLHASTASLTHAIVIPRPVAEAWFAPVHDLHGLVIGGAAAETLFACSAHLWELMPRLDMSEADRLGRLLLELLSVALLDARPSPSGRLSAEAVLRRKAVEEIERRLGGEIAVPDLCRALGVSRSRLFAAFRSDGGGAILCHGPASGAGAHGPGRAGAGRTDRQHRPSSGVRRRRPSEPLVPEAVRHVAERIPQAAGRGARRLGGKRCPALIRLFSAELSDRSVYWCGMADPRNTDPEDRDPRERELGRRSDGPAVSPWLVIGSLLLLGVVVYVISAVL